MSLPRCMYFIYFHVYMSCLLSLNLTMHRCFCCSLSRTLPRCLPVPPRFLLRPTHWLRRTASLGPDSSLAPFIILSILFSSLLCFALSCLLPPLALLLLLSSITPSSLHSLLSSLLLLAALGPLSISRGLTPLVRLLALLLFVPCEPLPPLPLLLPSVAHTFLSLVRVAVLGNRSALCPFNPLLAALPLASGVLSCIPLLLCSLLIPPVGFLIVLHSTLSLPLLRPSRLFPLCLWIPLLLVLPLPRSSSHNSLLPLMLLSLVGLRMFFDFVRSSPTVLHDALLRVLSDALTSPSLPPFWGIGVIHPAPKSRSDPTSCNSYRCQPFLLLGPNCLHSSSSVALSHFFPVAPSVPYIRALFAVALIFWIMPIFFRLSSLRRNPNLSGFLSAFWIYARHITLSFPPYYSTASILLACLSVLSLSSPVSTLLPRLVSAPPRASWTCSIPPVVSVRVIRFPLIYSIFSLIPLLLTCLLLHLLTLPFSALRLSHSFFLQMILALSRSLLLVSRPLWMPPTPLSLLFFLL